MDEVIEEVITPLTNNVLVRGGVKRLKSIYYNRFQVKARFVKMDKSVCSTLVPSFFCVLIVVADTGYLFNNVSLNR